MKTLSILSLWLASCILSLGAGALNGVAVTHWNGVALTAWNGSGVSAAGGGGGSPVELVTAYTGYSTNSILDEQGWAFVPSSNLTVTHLGAMFVTGCIADKTISLRTSGGTLITSATVALSGATLDVTTWGAVGSPAALTSGTTYVVMVTGAYNNYPFGGTPTVDATHITTGVEVTAAGTATGNGAAFPSRSYGINIRYTVP